MSPPIAHCERYVIDGGRCEGGPNPCAAATCPRLSEEVRTMVALMATIRRLKLVLSEGGAA